MALVSPMLLNSSFISLISLGKNIKPGGSSLLVHRTDSPLRCLASTNVSQRKSANYQSNIWDYNFLQSLKHDYADIRYEDNSMKLQEEVRRMINDENVDIWTTLELIDDVKRLGLSYHFEKDIVKVLDSFLSLERCNVQSTHINLHEVALSFRLLREYGYEVSADMFERFMDHNGNYKVSLGKDIKGMLSLYEASFLGYEGEEIMDKAKDFTSFHLRVHNEDKESIHFEKVSHALELPMHHRIQRMEAQWYIDAYGRRKDANRVLLDAAKLDFNIVQSTLQKDIQELSQWWKEMGLVPKISFSRDRLMECFFWTVGMVFEPQFSHVRKGLTKVTSLITIIDDVYDVYGTLDELELFSAAVESWNIKSIQLLPDYMKICFLALYNTINELAYDTLKDKGQFILPYLTKASELQRGEVANSIVCYMCENDVSYDGAYKHIHNLLDENWKKLNKDRVTYSPFPKPFVEIVINLARMSRCTYLYGDGHGAPDNAAKNRIWSLIIEPIAVRETNMKHVH
ncbi:PREDICTED: tricyclene synthase EBOS, chloroplastic-like isoform X2 [Lupinus angustifolius]|uniref:tricyclene synthase EBOS, chloroplastic-like isoform X2 n=1 Tax=Lupinus angustifolius TaxID=3871 RepID=UPI00092F3EDA|nr:PREDICTED: tricyclene synthase EBOS, chloroplastic-like isoform X2 [Lupinus angustifolius]